MVCCSSIKTRLISKVERVRRLSGCDACRGGRELTYNSKDQLIRVAYERDGQSVETNHVYGYDGQRVVTESPAGVSIWFGPDLVEHNGVVDHYVKVGDRLLARVRSSATNNETSSLDSPVQTETTYLHRSMGVTIPTSVVHISGFAEGPDDGSYEAEVYIADPGFFRSR